MIEDHDEIVLADPAELRLGLLFEEVRIDRLAAQQIDLQLPALVYVLESSTSSPCRLAILRS